MNPKHLIVQHVTFGFGTDILFHDFTYTFTTEDRISIVGINGAGKSTLLHLLRKNLQPIDGNVIYQGNITVGYVEQIHKDSEHTVLQELEKAFTHLSTINDRLHILEKRMSDGDVSEATLTEYAEVQEQFMSLGGYSLHAEIHNVLTGLRVPKRTWELPLSRLSGGERTKIALAKILLTEPDILLLDEPTNFLDISSVEWLEWFLNTKWKKGFVVVSHDRFFLDKVTKKTIEMIPERAPEFYPGNYSFYTREREQRTKRSQTLFDLQQNEIARQEEIVRRLKAGSRASTAKSREKMLAKMEVREAPILHKAPSITFKKADPSGETVLSLKDVIVGYDEEHPLYMIPQLMLRKGEKVALMGPNGSGKSTLIKTLMLELPTLTGFMSHGKNLRIGYFAQTLAYLDPTKSVLEEVFSEEPGMSREEIRKFMGRFLFSGEDTMKKIEVLSGGERARVALAKLTLKSTNFLLLDEPTNHLDYLAREALEKGLHEYKGTILFISHDRYFVDKIATHLWVIDPEKGDLTVHSGNYSDYLERKKKGSFFFESIEQEEGELLLAREWKKER